MQTRSTSTSPNIGRRHTPLRLLATTLGLTALALPARAADASQAALEQALRQLLRSQPELVREALDTLQQREALAATQRSQKALADAQPALQAEVGSTVLGNPAGDVTLVEFIDYRCGYCKQLAASLDTLLQRDPQLRLLVKHLPILGPDSVAAAQLMLSTAKGSQAARVHQALLAAPSLDAAALRGLAQATPWPPASTAAVDQDLAAVHALADQLGIQGTPALVIGDTLVRGAVGVAQLETLVRTARQTRAVSGAAPAANAQPNPQLARLGEPATGKR